MSAPVGGGRRRSLCYEQPLENRWRLSLKNAEKNRPLRQLFVPAMLLRRFADEQGMMHCFDKRQGKIYKVSPENAFVVRDLYTLTKPTGKDYSVETGLSQLEAATSGVLDRIIDAARSGMLPALSDIQRDTIDRFVAVQWRRTPESRETDPGSNHWLPERTFLRRAEQQFGPEAVSRELACGVQIPIRPTTDVNWNSHPTGGRHRQRVATRSCCFRSNDSASIARAPHQPHQPDDCSDQGNDRN